MSKKFVEEPEQRVWLWIGLVFAFFYFGEAFLFWGPNPRVYAPPVTPLIYWGMFGAAIVWLLSRQKKTSPPKAATRPPKAWESTVLGVGITASVVGLPFTVIAVTGNVSLGHVILLGAMFEAGIIIGGMSGSLGWMVASLVWLGSGLFILWHPHGQDYTLGFAVALGFIIIGLLRKCLCSEDPR